MGHSEDDVVHKIPHKMKTLWQNQLKFSVLVWFTILYRTRYKKIDVRLVQCPFKCEMRIMGCTVTKYPLSDIFFLFLHVYTNISEWLPGPCPHPQALSTACTYRGRFRGGRTRRTPPLFFAAIGCLTLCGHPRQKGCTKSCKLTLKITIFLCFWGGTDTPCPHRHQRSVSP